MKNKYYQFKKWVEQKEIQRRLNMVMVLWVISITIIIIGLLNTDFSSVLGVSTKKESPLIILPTPAVAVLTNAPTPTTIPCGPGQHSGQYVYLEDANECQNYTDCGFRDGSWKLMKKEDCTLAQKQDVSPAQYNTTTKIDCTGPDGKHFNATQKECDDFNAAWKKPQQNNQPQQPDWKTLVPYNGSTQNVSQNQNNNAYTPPQSYSCTIYNSTLKTSYTYSYIYKTKEECDAAQQKMNQDVILYQNPYQYPSEDTVSLPDNSYNQQQNGQCRIYADQWYANQGTQCSGSCAQAVKQIAYPEYQQKLKDCDSQYPI